MDQYPTTAVPALSELIVAEMRWNEDFEYGGQPASFRQT
jgi:hypothetical protein